jgi:NAD(P)-dependent dehydrogenase (short-subunit alcohol dehydrogenase family)
MTSRTDKLSLVGKVAIVTGAGSGIGRASARLLAERGAIVVVADVAEDQGIETAKLIGDRSKFIAADITDQGSIADLVKATISAFGRLDIAHNNAAIYVTGPNIADTDKETWDRVLAINLTGMFLAMREEIPAGLTAQPGQPGYVPAKHGVIGLTKAAAVEYSGRGIRVNAVLPGPTRTPMTQRLIEGNPDLLTILNAAIPMRRLGEPEEPAEAVAWLASDAASFVTGATLSVDGGFVAQ